MTLTARAALFVAPFLLIPAATEAAPLLNEVLYDPPGSDSGGEFVELINTAAHSLSLAGLRLQFCNGASPGDWETLWEGESGDSLAADGLWLIAESEALAPDAQVPLGMQNGPEALRLMRAGEVLDLLGYGDGLDPSLFEGWPAGDPSGRSLSRRPDGIDTDQNALDWFAAEPTPGRLNFPAFRVRILAAAAPVEPVQPGREFSVALRVENGGLDPWPGVVECRWPGAESAAIAPVAPGHVAEFDYPLPARAAGEYEGRLRVGLRGEQENDSLSLRLRVGLGPLMLAECQFAPVSGEPEWVELLALEPLSGLESFRLCDPSGTGSEFTPPPLAAGERILLCADREAMLAAYSALDAALVFELSPWPSLANSGESEALPGWTDGLCLDDAAGRCDGLLYRGDWIPARGTSLERLSPFAQAGLSPWSASPAGPTPLAGASPLAAPIAAGALRLSPNPFDPEREWLSFEIAGGTGGDLRLRLYDAAGRSVQTIESRAGGGTTRLVWDGRDRRGLALPDGFYPFLIEFMGDGRASRRGHCVLRRRG